MSRDDFDRVDVGVTRFYPAGEVLISLADFDGYLTHYQLTPKHARKLAKQLKVQAELAEKLKARDV